jgi:hypothetical protein
MPKSADRQDWLSLPKIFFCRSKTHYTTAAKLTLRVQTVAAVSASFRQERKRKISNAAQTNPVYRYFREMAILMFSAATG